MSFREVDEQVGPGRGGGGRRNQAKTMAAAFEQVTFAGHAPGAQGGEHGEAVFGRHRLVVERMGEVHLGAIEECDAAIVKLVKVLGGAEHLLRPSDDLLEDQARDLA